MLNVEPTEAVGCRIGGELGATTETAEVAEETFCTIGAELGATREVADWMTVGPTDAKAAAVVALPTAAACPPEMTRVIWGAPNAKEVVAVAVGDGVIIIDAVAVGDGVITIDVDAVGERPASAIDAVATLG